MWTSIKQLALGLALAVLTLTGVPAVALACTICYGEPGHPMTLGLQNGVLILIGAISVVLGLFVALIVMFARRARRLECEQPETPA